MTAYFLCLAAGVLFRVFLALAMGSIGKSIKEKEWE